MHVRWSKLKLYLLIYVLVFIQVKSWNYHEYVREMYTHLNLIFFFKTYARPRKLEVNKLIIIIRQLSCTRYWYVYSQFLKRWSALPNWEENRLLAGE